LPAHTVPHLPFEVKKNLFLVLRLLVLAAAASGSWHWTVGLLLLQTAIMPQSLVISIMLLCALVPPIFCGHYLAEFGVSRLLALVVPAHLRLEITITNAVIAVFFLWDQALCMYCIYCNPQGDVNPQTLGWHAKHWLFALLNTKAYQLALLLLMRGSTVSLTSWLLAAAIPLGPMVSKVASRLALDWSVLFYHAHRLAHLPVVYQDAHKMHHYFHDASPYDAHLYGSGAPEELASLLLELTAWRFFGLLPASFGYHILVISWTNKVGHTRKVDGSSGVNHHVDHHVYHSKNFGIFR